MNHRKYHVSLKRTRFVIVVRLFSIFEHCLKISYENKFKNLTISVVSLENILHRPTTNYSLPHNIGQHKWVILVKVKYSDLEKKFQVTCENRLCHHKFIFQFSFNHLTRPCWLYYICIYELERHAGSSLRIYTRFYLNLFVDYMSYKIYLITCRYSTTTDAAIP